MVGNFVERDEVVLSTNVHNYFDEAKEVTTELSIPADLLKSCPTAWMEMIRSVIIKRCFMVLCFFGTTHLC